MDAAIIIPIGFVPGDVEVFQIRVRDPDGILPPMVGQGLKVPVVVLAVLLKMDDCPFLFLLWFHPYHEF